MASKERAKSILSAIFYVFAGIVLLCNLGTFVARTVFNIPYPTVFGFTNAVVLSGSMEPAISVNDMVVIQAKDSYEAGDVISFQSGDVLVTHRIVEKTEHGYITKGDANNTNDDEVPAAQVVGKVVVAIPCIGNLILALQTPLAMLLCALGLTAIVFIPHLFGEESERTEE